MVPTLLHVQRYDRFATSILTAELRKTYVALWVAGDGNCFWRAVTKALWGSDKYWRQVKLVVLGWTAVYGKGLLGDADVKYVSNEIYSKHSVFDNKGNRSPDAGSYDKMLLESIGKLCEFGAWGGDITALMVSEAFRIAVKVVVPTDKKARAKNDAEGKTPPHGTGRDGSNIEDCRHSRSFVPVHSRCAWQFPAMDGKGVVIREEVVVAMTPIIKGSHATVLESELTGVPEVDQNTTYSKLAHFAAVVNKNGGACPFPLHEAAPPLFKIQVGDFFGLDRLVDCLAHGQIAYCNGRQGCFCFVCRKFGDPLRRNKYPEKTNRSMLRKINMYIKTHSFTSRQELI